MRQRIAALLSKAIFAALLGLMIFAAVAYGGSDPAWKAFFASAIFALGAFAALEMVLSDNDQLPGFTILVPGLVLVLFAAMQTVRLSSSDGQAYGIHHRFWNSVSADPYETRVFALQVLALIVLAALLFRYAKNERRLRRLIHTIIAVAALSAIFGLLRQTMQHQPGFLLPLLQPDQGYGQFFNRNHFAYLMEIGLGLGLGFLAAGAAQKRAIIYLAALLPTWIALVLCNSRGGILAMLVQLIVTLLLFPIAVRDGDHGASGARRLIRSTVVRLVLAGSLIGLVILGALWIGGDRLASSFEATRGEFNESTESRDGVTRVQIWRATMRMIKANPIVGVGMGAYWTAIPTYHEAAGTMTPQQAHNDYLELLASGGILGLGIMIWFVVGLFKSARVSLRSRSRFRRAACFAALVGIAGVAVHSVVDFGLHRMVNAMLFVALIVIATCKMDHRSKRLQEHA